jgi:hypothetical protein
MRTWLVALLAMAAGCLETGAVMASNPEQAIRPSEVIRLFNGKDLTNVYTWLVDHKHEDRDRVFSVVDRNRWRAGNPHQR